MPYLDGRGFNPILDEISALADMMHKLGSE